MNKSKAEQTYLRIRSAIASGQYAPGSRLPPEPEFCRELDVSRGTLRLALSRLAEEGLLERSSRRGTTVLGREPVGSRKILFLEASRKDEVEECLPFLHILPSVDQACRQRHVNIDHLAMRQLPRLEIMPLAERFSQGYQGIICTASYFLGHEPLLKLLRATRLPVVLAHARAADHQVTGLAVIATDERAAFADGLRHLAGFGHRRVATVWLADGDHRGYSEDDYAALLTSLGMDSDPSLCITLPRYDEKGVRAMITDFFQRQTVRPTALMCYSDYTALLCYPVLRQLGLRIPEDVAMMGYSGPPERAQLMNPPLSNVDVGLGRIGVMAVELLLRADEWHRPGMAPPLVYSPYIVNGRQSTDYLIWENLLQTQLGEQASC
mgnify:FL=1